MAHEHHIDPVGDDEALDASYLRSPLIGPIVRYVRLLHFAGPEQARRYYRLFGDMEYDVLTLNAELAAMQLRLREVRRRAERCAVIPPEDERTICVTAHDLTEHLYRRAEEHHAKSEAARSFHYDAAQERRALLLFGDIAAAVLGIADGMRRDREHKPLEEAIEAYRRLDLPTLIDLHDAVQPIVAQPRREGLDASERAHWAARTAELQRTHPLSRAAEMDDPHWITLRIERLRRSARRLQSSLEYTAMVYVALVRAARFRN
jgi:hypothetical protein